LSNIREQVRIKRSIAKNTGTAAVVFYGLLLFVAYDVRLYGDSYGIGFQLLLLFGSLAIGFSAVSVYSMLGYFALRKNTELNEGSTR
jgi:hypothetical protein